MTGTQGLAVGAILSGVLTELLGKRWIVLISVPLIESVPIATSSLVRASLQRSRPRSVHHRAQVSSSTRSHVPASGKIQ